MHQATIEHNSQCRKVSTIFSHECGHPFPLELPRIQRSYERNGNTNWKLDEWNWNGKETSTSCSYKVKWSQWSLWLVSGSIKLFMECINNALYKYYAYNFTPQCTNQSMRFIPPMIFQLNGFKENINRVWQHKEFVQTHGNHGNYQFQQIK